MSGSISRGPDGIHLDAKGIQDLYKFFADGGSAYGATKRFGLSYGGARERLARYQREKNSPAPNVALTPEERATLAAALPIIQKVLNATA